MPIANYDKGQVLQWMTNHTTMTDKEVEIMKQGDVDGQTLLECDEAILVKMGFDSEMAQQLVQAVKRDEYGCAQESSTDQKNKKSILTNGGSYDHSNTFVTNTDPQPESGGTQIDSNPQNDQDAPKTEEQSIQVVQEEANEEMDQNQKYESNCFFSIRAQNNNMSIRVIEFSIWPKKDENGKECPLNFQCPRSPIVAELYGN